MTPEAAGEHGQLRKERDDFLKPLTPAEKLVLYGHAVSFCTLEGISLSFEGEKEDLFKKLSQMERFIVDTNSNWKQEAAKPEHRDKAFILGNTIAQEQDDIKGLLFGPKTQIHNGNIFVVSVFHPEIGIPLIMLEQLDEHYRGIFDEDDLCRASRPRKEKEKAQDPKFLEQHTQFVNGVNHEKQVMLLILGKLNAISELRSRDDLTEKRNQLLTFIRERVPFCLGQFERSVQVALHCYALLLMEMQSIRTEFAKPDYFNVFGDTRIVQNALLLGAGILTGDKPLKRMAGYAGIKCTDKIA